MSISGIPSLGRFELAARVVLDGSTGSWFVVGVEDGESAAILGEEIESLAEESVAVLTVSDRDSLVAGSHEHAGGLAVSSPPLVSRTFTSMRLVRTSSGCEPPSLPYRLARSHASRASPPTSRAGRATACSS